MNFTTEATTAVAQRKGRSCPNLENGFCTERTHSVVASMLAGQVTSPPSRGRLFMRGRYPQFEGGCGYRYVREYLPLHLPQLEYGLEQAFKALKPGFPADRAIRLLDIGSGPASVALALERLVAKNSIQGQFDITPVEQSSEFCRMLGVAAEHLTGSVRLRKPCQMNLNQYLAVNPAVSTGSFDWIVMANVLSPLAQGHSSEEYCATIQNLLDKNRTPSGYPALTLIEGSCLTYVQPSVYMTALAQQLTDICHIGLGRGVLLHRPNIMNCSFYRTKYGCCTPRVLMVTVKKEAS